MGVKPLFWWVFNPPYRLYAAGNSSASVMGHTYPGPGSTIGPAMVFGMIAGRHAAGMI